MFTKLSFQQKTTTTENCPLILPTTDNLQQLNLHNLKEVEVAHYASIFLGGTSCFKMKSKDELKKTAFITKLHGAFK